MNTDEITAFFTAVAAITGLGLGVFGLWKQNKLLDAENLLKIMDRSFEAESKFSSINTKSVGEKEWIANEHFNFLEGIACLFNNKLVNKYSRKWCKDVLINNLAAIQNMIWIHEFFEKSVTKEDTYKELRIFIGKHKLEINGLSLAHRP